MPRIWRSAVAKRTDPELLRSVHCDNCYDANATYRRQRNLGEKTHSYSCCVLCEQQCCRECGESLMHQMPDMPAADTVEAEAIFRMKWLCYNRGHEEEKGYIAYSPLKCTCESVKTCKKEPPVEVSPVRLQIWMNRCSILSQKRFFTTLQSTPSLSLP